MDDSSSSPLSSVPDTDPSSPLSSLSNTPSPPSSPSPLIGLDASRRYPSPTSTATSGTQSPTKLGGPMEERDLRENARSSDGAPPAKKRKIAAPKERTTEYLDLTKPYAELSDSENRQMERLMSELRKRKKVVVIAGAGISTSAGIPDFRSSTGLFATGGQQKMKASGKHLFDASVYKHDATTQSFHTMVREMAEMTKKAEPTPFHHLLASLAKEGRLLRLYSQNIDCIDTSMEPLSTNVPLNSKGPWPSTIQLHGGLQKMVCTKCGELKPFNSDLFDGPEAPLCETCKQDDEVRTSYAGKRSHGIGRLRPRFVLYNEYNPDEEAIGNVSSADLKSRPDAVIVVGTTLKVPGTRRLVKELCQVARGRRDGFTAWINVAPEPKGIDFKDCWDLVVKSRCDDVAKLAALPPWDCNIGEDYLLSKEQDLLRQESREKSTLQVRIRSSRSPDSVVPKGVEAIQSIPTPRPSPIPTKKQTTKKQTKLTFSKFAAPTEDTKAKARKPKQAAKDKGPKNTILHNFKTTKTVSDRQAVKKLALGDSQKPLPSKEVGKPRVALPALRPAKDTVSNSFVYKREDVEEKIVELIPTAPTTPPMAPRRLSRDTISPKSVPNNMRNLIDMDG